MSKFYTTIICRLLLSAILSIAISSQLLAGGGPENVLLVMNANSKDSLEIGNAYRLARNIPFNNIVTLNTSTDFQTSYLTYQDEIESPILSHLKNHQLLDQIFFIVLTCGIPQTVTIADGRATASMLAAANLPNRQPGISMPNPYFNAPDAFSQRPANLKGMYLVTVLDGYHTADIHQLINNGANSDSTFPAGRFLFQTNGANFPRLERVKSMLGIKNLSVEILSSPPENKNGIMAYFSAGTQNGLSKDFITSCTFLPGAIADYSQQFGASPKNFDESSPPVFLPASAFIRAGTSGVHGLIGGADIRTIPINAAPHVLLEKYTDGYSLAESFYAAMPVLNGQNIIFGDPLTAPYARRPVISLEMDTPPAKGIVPVRVTASSPMPDTTIRRIDAYLDDRLLQTIYEPSKTEITLYIGVEVITYHSPRGNTLRSLLEGLAKAVNDNPILSLADGVRAVPILATGRLQLLARAPGKESNEIPLGIEIRTLEEGDPSIVARLNGGWLEGGGTNPAFAGGVVSFLGRKIVMGDTVDLQIEDQHFNYTITAENQLADLPAALADMINNNAVLKKNNGVAATSAASRMPFLQLTARRPGEAGNNITYQVKVIRQPTSTFNAFPNFSSQFTGGHDGNTASQTIQFMLGEMTAKTRFLLDTSNLSDGHHQLRFVATDGSLAQVQGWYEQSFMSANSPLPPLVRLPNILPPVSSEAVIPISSMQNVARVDIFVDNKFLGSADIQPFNVRIPLTGLGRGKHSLWAVASDDAGNSYITPPAILEIITPPVVTRCVPNYCPLNGDTIHRIIGEGFLPDCTVKLAGVAVTSVKYINPNVLEVVSAPGTARTGWVEVHHADGTQSLPSTAFEYYTPQVSSLRISPALEVLPAEQKAQFASQAFDQHDYPMNADVTWKVIDARAGSISRNGLFSAGKTAGAFLISASSNEITTTAEITVGAALIPKDGFLRHWLLVGPFPDPDENTLEIAHIAEGVIRPIRGELADDMLTWKSLYSDKSFIDMAAAFQPNQMVTAYAHIYLKAPAETTCQLQFGSDDGIRILLNGEQLTSLRVRRPAEPNQNQQQITLKEGWNHLLVKVDQGNGSWGFYMKLSPLPKQILPEIYYSLDKPSDDN